MVVLTASAALKQLQTLNKNSSSSSNSNTDGVMQGKLIWRWAVISNLEQLWPCVQPFLRKWYQKSQCFLAVASLQRLFACVFQKHNSNTYETGHRHT